jgi:hypothetical protein
MSIRTLFLFIRGIDQTGRAVNSTMNNMDKLQKKQRELQQTSFRLMFAGAAFATFGFMMGKALFSTLQHSMQGVRMLTRLERSFGRLQRALGNKILDTYGKQLEQLINSLIKLSENDEVLDKLAKGLDLAIGFILVGGSMLVGGASAIFINTIAGMLISSGVLTSIPAFAALVPFGVTAVTLAIGTMLVFELLGIDVDLGGKRLEDFGNMVLSTIVGSLGANPADFGLPTPSNDDGTSFSTPPASGTEAPTELAGSTLPGLSFSINLDVGGVNFPDTTSEDALNTGNAGGPP